MPLHPAQTGTIYRSSYQTRGQETLLRVYGRDTEGRKIDRTLTGLASYFYVHESEADKIKRVTSIIRTEPGPPDTDGNPTQRCFTQHPMDVRDARSGFDWHGEADIIWTNRTRVDYGLIHVTLPESGTDPVPISKVVSRRESPLVNPREVFYDLEVEDANGFARPELPVNPITAISFLDTYRDRVGCIYNGPRLTVEEVRQYFPRPVSQEIRLYPRSTERDVVAAFGSILMAMDPDIMSGWNSGVMSGANSGGYDHPYLGGRAARLLKREPDNPHLNYLVNNFEPDERRNRGRLALTDDLQLLRKLEVKQKTFSLEATAQLVLGYGKVERPPKVSTLQKENPAKWVAYNIWDSVLTYLIDRKKNLIEFGLGVVQLAYSDLDDVMQNSHLWDGLLLAQARWDGPVTRVLPSKKMKAPKTETGEGAEVFPSVPGLHEWVIALDLKGSYPSIQKTFNISPETRVPPGTPDAYHLASGGWYRKEPLGIAPQALFRMSDARDVIKAQMSGLRHDDPLRHALASLSNAYKVLANSLSGILGSGDWRLGDKAMYEDVTQTARAQLVWNKVHVEDPVWLQAVIGADYTAIALMGDTDSGYFTLRKNGVQVTDLDELVRCAKAIRDGLNESYTEFAAQFGAATHYTSVDLEAVFEKLKIPTGKGSKDGVKKKYYALYAWEDGHDLRDLPIEKRMKVSGVEAKKFNFGAATKKVQNRIMQEVLGGKTVESIREWVEDERSQVPTEDLWIPYKYKPREQYDATRTPPEFARAAYNWENITGRKCQEFDEMRWCHSKSVTVNGRVTPVELIAVPLHLTDDELERQGITVEMNVEKMLDRCYDGPSLLVLPELAEAASLAGDW